MLRSMTGFARRDCETGAGGLTLELRSVNHRYLDVRLDFPDSLRAWEPVLRARLRARLQRGRIEARLHCQPRGGARFVLDHELAGEIAAAARELSGPGARDGLTMSAALRLLAWPGVMETARPRLDASARQFEALCDAAIDALVAAREREGGALAAALSERLRALEEGIERVRAESAGRQPALKTRLSERLAALGAELDAERIAREAALLVVRQDVDEEIARLAAHAGELERLLGAGGALGRRLDFLMQELGREANTLASKAATLEVNREALECKVLIEAMREQVQNVE